jgi:hypothetical protein
MQRITELEDGAFQPSYAEVRRFRCSACGATDSDTSPETEPGFRLSTAAADGIVEASIRSGMKKAGEAAGVDAATVSRLVTARAERLLGETTRPRVARIEGLGTGVVAVSDAWTGEVSACFAGGDDPRLMPWLAKPYPSVVVPSGEIMAQAIRWAGATVVIANETVVDALLPLIERARQRMMEMVRSAEELAMNPAALERHFVRASEKLFSALDAAHHGLARGMVSTWIENCRGVWSEVFAPVLRFLSTYRDCLFTHAVCMEPLPRRKLDFVGPANLMTLALNPSRHLTYSAPDGPKPPGPILVYR